MISRKQLLTDLRDFLKTLEADLLARSESADVPEVCKALKDEYKIAKEAKRTALTYEVWRSDYITQMAAAWVLSCVFVRFLEDNQLIDPPSIAGDGDRLQWARDEHQVYFTKHPTETDREYLLNVFGQLRDLNGGVIAEVFGPHNVVWQLPNWLSGDAAGQLLEFWRKINPDTGHIVHDFVDPQWDTRFLGDLYQDLSESARKKYALLQTPDFVEEFILDRTLEPALDEFGLTPIEPTALAAGSALSRNTPAASAVGSFKMIDPACGSGHFLLGSFPRILKRWKEQEPGTNIRELVQRTLDSIHGVDINPFAIAIARFRLLLAALQACGVSRLADAPIFHMNLACGDSLYHGKQRQMMLEGIETDESHYFRTEDADNLSRILQEGCYHAVVANPPYIVPKDKAANKAYRKLYPNSCHRQYSLSVPFMERIFRLAVSKKEPNAVSASELNADRAGAAGYTGQITANSFMKREFGKKLIESLFPLYDLTHVIDTSGAYIPGHGTPTVILFGRNRKPVAGTIRTVMGIRGEPSTPADPAMGLVWSSIVEQLDQPGSQSEFVSVADSDRQLFHKHPWSIGGGGAAELKELLESNSVGSLATAVSSIGFYQDTHADEAFVQPIGFSARLGLKNGFEIQIRGDNVRDWGAISNEEIFFPYERPEINQWATIPNEPKWSWIACLRTELWERSTFGGGTYRSTGRPWFDYHQFPKDRAITPMSVAYAEVATHNHFVLDRGGKVFNRTAPVIKLPAKGTEDDHLGLLGILNSSTACFWMKQGAHNKGDSTDNKGARTTGDVAFNTFAFNGTLVGKFPLAEGRPTNRTRQLNELAQQLQKNGPESVLAQRHLGTANGSAAELKTDYLASLREGLKNARRVWEQVRGEMIFLQEELDWECYRLYGLIDKDLTYQGRPFPMAFGERSFEVLLARMIHRGVAPPTTWFERQKAIPLSEPPRHWPDDYLDLFHRRNEVQQSNPQIALIEQPEYKRRWNTEPWDSQVERALKSWLLDRLESYFDFDGRMSVQPSAISGQEEELTADKLNADCSFDIQLVSTAKLADVAAQDTQFMEVAEVYKDDPAFDVPHLVHDLVAEEHVPLLPVERYKPSGLRKRVEWEQTWEFQREEDAISDQLSAISDQLKKATDELEKKRLKTEQEKLTAESCKLTATIPVPPKYTSGDFISRGGVKFWKLRGKLDVPKERWVSFPNSPGEDGSLMIAWAGYDHLQLARAISAHYIDIRDNIGGSDDPRLVPLLTGLIELLPWLRQWHHDIDPEFDQRMDEYFDTFIRTNANELKLSVDDVRDWRPA